MACAALLAKAGRSVAVFESAAVVGGAAVSDRSLWPGYTLSTASYVLSLLDPWLVEYLDLRSHGLSYYRKDPYAFTPLRDGRSLLLGSDKAANAREISAFEPRDVDGLANFIERTDRLGRALFDTFSDDEPEFGRFDAQTQADLRGSAAELVEQYISTPVLAAELVNDGLIGTYRGPRDPGTGYVLAHHLAGRVLGVQGAWAFVRGGMGSVSRALASAALAHGAHLFVGDGVERVLLDEDGEAYGIVAGGATVRARAVASNAHPRTTFLDLLEEGALDSTFVTRVEQWQSVGCSLKVNLALGELPNFTSRPGKRGAAASSRDDSPSPERRLSAEGLHRRAPARRKRSAAGRVLPADADGAVARAAGQTHPLGFRPVLSVRSGRRLDGCQTRSGGRHDRRDAGRGCAESSWRRRAPASAGRARSRGALRLTRRAYLSRRALTGADLRAAVCDTHAGAESLSLRFGRAPGRLRQRFSWKARGYGNPA